LLNDLPQVHDSYAIANVSNDRQIVGDEEQGEPELVLQIPEQVQDLCLDGNVQCADGFIADQELGTQSDGAGDADSLSLAAGEFMRKAKRVGLMQPYALEKFCHSPSKCAAPFDPMDDQRFGNDVTGIHPRIQATLGILKDDLQGSPYPAKLGP
jgi:hypothetical protein